MPGLVTRAVLTGAIRVGRREVSTPHGLLLVVLFVAPKCVGAFRDGSRIQDSFSKAEYLLHSHRTSALGCLSRPRRRVRAQSRLSPTRSGWTPRPCRTSG